MIKLIDAYLSFGSHAVIDGVSWMLGDHDRIGLVGENGSGKSTLLKLLAGVEEFEGGRREVSRHLRIGYLPQQGVIHRGRTLEEEIKAAVEEILALKDEHDRLEHRLSTKPLSAEAQETLIHRQAELWDRFVLAGGLEISGRIGKILAGLGFRESDRDQPVESFSGGWQMRIALAKLLLARPNVLLLDEPTNHLDLEARNWLEEYLREFNGSYLIVSHDRYFLDVTVDRIVEIENGKLSEFRGNYSDYVKEKQRQVEAALNAYGRQQEEIQRLNAFIAKYKADKKRAGQVQSRKKMLARMELLEPPRYRRPIRFHFPDAPPSPQEMVRLRGVIKRYGAQVVLDRINLSIFRGEKIAVVGPNGSGKSTLLSLLAGVRAADEGEREENDRVLIAYFGQDAGQSLEEQDTVLEAVSRGAPFEMYPRLRALLGAFLFREEDFEKKVSALSGGERSRLALARLLLRPANLLLLDEPTNHLDLKAKDVLLEAFRRFSGALVFVAHDRYFLEDLPHRILEVVEGKVNSYPGNYRDYLWAKEKQAKLEENHYPPLPEAASGGKKRNEPARPPAGAETSMATLSPEEKKKKRLRQREEEKARRRLRQKCKKEQAALEESIAATEEELRRMEARMADPSVACDYLKLMGLEKTKAELAAKLRGLYEKWERLAGENPPQ